MKNIITHKDFYWFRNCEENNKPEPFKTIFFIENKIIHLGYFHYNKNQEPIWSVCTNYQEKDGKIFPITKQTFHNNFITHWAYMPDYPF